MSSGPSLAGSVRERVTELITACWTTQVIHEAVRLNLPDRLAAGPASSDELAAVLEVDADALYRLMRALASLGLLLHLRDHLFELTADGAALRSDAPNSLRGIALHWGDRQWKSFGLLGRAIATGKPQVAEGFENLQKDPGQAAVFNRAMAEQSYRIGAAAARAYDFRPFKRVLDVGGGYGAVLAALLKANPTLRGASFDLPEVEIGARGYLKEQGVVDRAEYLGGSFFESVPSGFDCHVLKFIVHDWGDAESKKILANCARAVSPGGVVLLLEQVVPERILPDRRVAGILRGDLIMLNIGGRERTEREYRSLLAASGLELTRILPTDTPFSVIEARPTGAARKSTT
jgi:SAM-dependent methyltransferase